MNEIGMVEQLVRFVIRVLGGLGYRIALVRGRLVGILVPGVSTDRRTVIEAGVKISCGPRAHISLEGSRISRGTRIEASDGALIAASDCFFGRDVVVSARKSISIGKRSRIAEMSTIRDHEHEYSSATGSLPQEWRADPIELGEVTWLGSKVTVTSGVTLGARCAVGANSVVTKSAAPGSVLGGIPARVLRKAPDAG